MAMHYSRSPAESSGANDINGNNGYNGEWIVYRSGENGTNKSPMATMDNQWQYLVLIDDR